METPSAPILSSPTWRLRPALRRPMPVLAAGQVHEVHGEGDDRAAGLAFALGLGTANRQGAVLVVRGALRQGLGLYGEGLARLGIDPARLLLVEARDAAALLRAGLEGARCPGLALVLLESEGPLKGYDLTASRRFVLAAERTQTPLVLLRHAARPQPSAAHTRWQVASAPSLPLEAPPGAQVRPPGLPMIAVEALRWRGGPAGQTWHLQWDEQHGGFRDTTGSLGGTPNRNENARTAPSGAVLPMAALRTG
ncbi:MULTISPECIES: hypothetical protein [unclassified Novosphingobium]|uniref:ImuA family protein n=1 Tax=unclassified Novosphingobium TaxID=2644732 RepID=UPI00146E279C|nr:MULTISPECIES: hypothetical protein [unclassified Novosphingobium]NMN04329.1 protein ImuA [Novosphingobium sp. SG919]NMN85680.1 protein ImuA [Novosphingobium sp. SG916]